MNHETDSHAEQVDIDIQREKAIAMIKSLEINLSTKRPKTKYKDTLYALKGYIKLATSKKEAEGYLKYAMKLIYNQLAMKSFFFKKSRRNKYRNRKIY